MTKEDILEYVSRTPYNTNPNMIGNMIDALMAQSGGGLPDPSEASVGDVLALDEEKQPIWSSAVSEIFNKVVTASVVVETKSAITIDAGDEAQFRTVTGGNCKRTITCSDGGTYSSSNAIILGYSNRNFDDLHKGVVLQSIGATDTCMFYNTTDLDVTVPQGKRVLSYEIYFIRK